LTLGLALGGMDGLCPLVPAVPQLSLHSPVGDLTISEEEGALVALDWGWGRDQTPTPLLREVRQRIQSYFDGQMVDFDDLPIHPLGTAYRQRVWAALRRIPRGETRTYLALARDVGGSPRSVGQANRANPIPIIVPCHRVVAVGGLGGYSGEGGLAAKRHLLALEGAAGWERAA
jgi:methylated-DNA-[protein]-cysteine S-methyltransferase